MRLTKALKEKNRLIKKITILRKQIISNNVSLEDNAFTYSINTLQKKYESLIKILVDLKTAIQIANQPILKKIYTLGELKSTISMFEGMDTKEGFQESCGYGNTELYAYKVQMNRSHIDKQIANLQNQIDIFQDEIDTFNATTTVDFVLE